MSASLGQPTSLGAASADLGRSGHFDNAVSEYTSALDILTQILPPYNRSLSELHMLIALALDFVPDSIDRAVSHAEKAKAVLLLKLEQLEGIKDEEKTDKDKKEITDIKELMGDVDMKVSLPDCRLLCSFTYLARRCEQIEDLKVVPEEAPKTESEKRLDELLKGAADAKASGVVNNLNSLVKKKKKVVDTVEEVVEEGKGKRKADEPVAEGSSEEKRAKVDEETKA